MTPENLKECLKTVVGLAKRSCPCDGLLRPVDAATSLSGYYMTDSADGVPLSFVGGAVDCGAGGVWDILEDARNEGIGDFIRDMSLNIGDIYKKSFQDFNGRIGELNDTTWVTNAKKYAVVRVRGFKDLPAKLKLISASLKTTCTAPITISVYDTETLTGVPIATITVNAVTSTWQTTAWPTPVELDLKNDYYTYQDYYLTWEIPAGCFMANSTNGCFSCSGGKQKGWKPFLEVQAYSVNDLADFAGQPAALVTLHGEMTLGLSLFTFIGCNFGDWMCGLDFLQTDSGFALTAAKMMQYAQVIKLVTVLVNTPNINSITLLSKENLYGRRAHAQKEYTNGVRWIAENLPEDALRCYECKDRRMVMRQLIV